MQTLKIEKFKTIPGYDCLNICIRNSCSYFGKSISDEELYFTAGPKKVFYNREHRRLFSNSHKSVHEFVMKNGLAYKDKEAVNEEHVREYVKRILLEDKIMNISVKSNLLCYRNIYAQNSPLDHFVSLLGYDEALDKLYISDGYVASDKAQVFEGWVEADEILEAWRDTSFLHYIFSKDNIIHKNTYQLAYKNCKTTIGDYLTSKKSADNGYLAGEEAIKAYIQELTPACDLDAIVNQLKVYGFITIKRYIKSMLENEESLHGFADEYESIIKKWNTYCLMLYKMHIMKRMSALDKNIQFGIDLINREHQYLYDIRRNMRREDE